MSDERKRKVKLWRCQNPDCTEDAHERLRYDFEAPDPVCPKCGADQRTPEGRFTVVERVTLHYLVVDKAGAIITRGGRRTVACATESKKFIGPNAAHWEAVTCPDCKASEIYQQHKDEGTHQEGVTIEFKK
jgi:predicted nucleic-acid-binding Zn-ribbon protein